MEATLNETSCALVPPGSGLAGDAEPMFMALADTLNFASKWPPDVMPFQDETLVHQAGPSSSAVMSADPCGGPICPDYQSQLWSDTCRVNRIGVVLACLLAALTHVM